MANISVTYTFSNSTTADASQVNQNFQDIVDGLSNGTKDLSVSALTVAGNASFSGNVTLGNASGDDITVTGSLASSIAIKTTNSFSVGSATLGLASIYFGQSGGANTSRLLASVVASDLTLTLPSYSGTLANIPAVAASKTGSYSILSSDEFIPVSAASGAFSVTLPTAVGATGKVYTIKRTDSVIANAVTVATTSAQTIDGATTTTLNTQYESIEVLSDGSNWHVLKRDYPRGWATATVTLKGQSNDTTFTNQTVTALMRRAGDSAEFMIFAAFTGAPGSGTGNFKLELPVTIDTAKLGSATSFNQKLGDMNSKQGSVGNAVSDGGVYYYGSNYVGILQHGSVNAWSASAPITWANADSFSGTFIVPVSGWK